MPIYEYDCPEHGVFDERRKMADFDAPAACRLCGAVAPRVLSVPNLAAMAPSDVRARDRNERSRHEPTVASAEAMAVHRGGARGAGDGAAPAVSQGRPWMMGHG